MLYGPVHFGSKRAVRQESQRHWPRGESKVIVVALDGRTAAESALPHAVELARRWEAPLRLVQVVTPGQSRDWSESAAVADREWRSAQERSEAYLEGVAEAIFAADGIPVTWEVITDRSIESGLSSCTDGAGLLIVAKPARSSWSQFYWGSVTNSLVSQTDVPLLIIPTSRKNGHFEQTDYRRLLVCAGHGDVSENILRAAAAIAADGASCRLLHIVPHRAELASYRAAPLAPLELRQEAWLRLNRAAKWLNRHNVNASPRLMDDWRHSPAAALLAQAESMSADLIVLGTRRRWWPWRFGGGLPEYIARHSPRPVLLVPFEESIPVLRKADHVDLHSN